MKVIAGHTEGCSITWRPKPNDRAGHFFKVELRLDSSGLDEWRMLLRRTHSPGVDGPEVTIDAKCVEQIVRGAMGVTSSTQRFDRGKVRELKPNVRGERQD